jgi:transposase
MNASPARFSCRWRTAATTSQSDLQLAWEEYRQVHPEGYGYSRFCELYGRWRRKQAVVLRQEHKPGEKGFVDWAGATIPVQDPVSGEIWQASLFVMVLGASSYTYAEATRDQQLTAWLSAHMHAFEYFGGVPRLLVPDSALGRADRTAHRATIREDPRREATSGDGLPIVSRYYPIRRTVFGLLPLGTLSELRSTRK